MNCDFCKRKLGKKFDMLTLDPKSDNFLKKMCKNCSEFCKIMISDMRISELRTFDNIYYALVPYHKKDLYIIKDEEKIDNP